MPATLRVDTTGLIRFWSQEAEQLLGYSALEVIGQSVEIIIPHHPRERHRAGFARYVRTGISTLPEITTTVAVHKTGSQMKLPISVKAIFGEDKEVAAVEGTFYPHASPF
jgi:PAS domain S-box-containing protein